MKANEPAFFQEFGPPGFHVFIGFVKATDLEDASGSATLEGTVTNLHAARPPDVGFFSGGPQAATTPWVGLNNESGQMIYAQRSDDDGNFSIAGVPDGFYQLVVWDDYLDIIIAFKDIQVFGGTCVTGVAQTPLPLGCDFGDVPVFRWFTRIENTVFEDTNENGFWDDGETPMDLAGLDNVLFEQGTAIRFRDGSVYQAFPTDVFGGIPYDEVFPFFNWMVMEVGYDRYRATGATVVVDAGGDPNGGGPWSFDGLLNPQPQEATAWSPAGPYRVDNSADGTVLLEAFQGFIGHTSVIHWGKKAWPDIGGVPTGGIAGIVFYAVTRAENSPRLAAAEEWEPGVPGVTVRLFDETGTVLVNQVETDSWDDSLPEGCYWDSASGKFEIDDGLGGTAELDCFDGLRPYNQVRPGVFDGGYAFETYCPAGWFEGCTEEPLVAGTYVVDIIVPTGYELMKEEDKNVDFGREYDPESEAGLQTDALYTWLESYYPWAQGGLFTPACVGGPHTVPAELALFPGVEAPFAGETRPLCDRKKVTLRAGMNFGVADFYIFTETPVAAHIVGFSQNDLANEFDPVSPNFGEKYAPPWTPVSIRDWTGKEIQRVYTDEFGKYNAIVPSTFSANLLIPSGMSPNMLIACMNDPGPISDGGGGLITDPRHRKPVQPVLLHLPIHAGNDDLSRHPSPSSRGLCRPAARLRASGRDATSVHGLGLGGRWLRTMAHDTDLQCPEAVSDVDG